MRLLRIGSGLSKKALFQPVRNISVSGVQFNENRELVVEKLTGDDEGKYVKIIPNSGKNIRKQFSRTCLRIFSRLTFF